MTAGNKEAGKDGKRAARPPNADMQADDAGTSRSGQPRPTVRGAATGSPAKQDSRTGKGPGSRGGR